MRRSTEVYESRANDIRRIVAGLPSLLAKHEARMESDPANWGYAGDLQEVRNRLIGAVATLTNMSIADVEESLHMRVSVRV